MFGRVPLPPTFTTKAARSAGLHPRDLYASRDSGEFIELSRGVFRLSDAPPASYPDLLAVAYRAPRAIVCCLSAAVIHELTDELPPDVQIAVPKGTHLPRIDHPPTTALRFDVATFTLGLSAHEAAPGERIRVYDAARTVVDLVRMRHRFGESVAYSALHRFLRTPGTQPRALLDYARELGVIGPMRTILDVADAR